MGRIRVNKTVEKPIRREEKKPITAYRATRLVILFSVRLYDIGFEIIAV